MNETPEDSLVNDLPQPQAGLDVTEDAQVRDPDVQAPADLARKTALPRPAQPLWVKPFLREVQRHGNLSKACKKAGTSYQNMLARRKSNLKFEKALHRARKRWIDRAEEECYRRGVKGYERGGITFYSDDLLKFFLRANRKQYASTSTVTHKGAVVVSEEADPLTQAERFAQLVSLVERITARPEPKQVTEVPPDTLPPPQGA